MSTLKQKELARLTLENPKLAKDGKKHKLVELGGYSLATQKQPGKVLDSPGYKAELAKLGLTEDFIAKALIDDINGKPKRRVRELELGADILNMRKREEKGNNQVIIVNISGEIANKYGPKSDSSSTPIASS